MFVSLLSALLLLVAHQHLWQLILVMAIAGVAGGMELRADARPAGEFGPRTRNRLCGRLKHGGPYLSFSLGTAVAAVILSGEDSSLVPTGDSFRWAIWTNAAIWSFTLLIGLLRRWPPTVLP